MRPPHSCALKHKAKIRFEVGLISDFWNFHGNEIRRQVSKRKTGREETGMELFLIGFGAGIMVSIFVTLMQCALWFDERYPEDDYWHRGNRRKSRRDRQKKLKPAGDLQSSKVQQYPTVLSAEETAGSGREAADA